MTAALVGVHIKKKSSRKRKERERAENTPAGFLKRAAVAAPAAGILIAVGRGAEVEMNFTGGFFGSFLSACGWALMLAAGAVVYQHFLAKWQNAGLTMAPVAAMGTPPYMSQPGHQQQHHRQEHHQRSYSHPPPANNGHALPNTGPHHPPQRGPSSRYDC